MQICRELHFAFHHAVHHDHAMRTIASQLGQTTKVSKTVISSNVASQVTENGVAGEFWGGTW